ncbi:MAG: Papd-like protein [Ramlibacter sp.]|nr:Papd-like protein [Ramlibacter sp.]
MNSLRRFFLALVALAAFAVLPSVQAQTTTPTALPKALVLYDQNVGSQWEKLGFGYAIMLRNLLGHFDAQVDMVPVQQYTAGRIENYSATFYVGSEYDHQLPAAFMNDAVTTTKTVVWFKYNLWQLAWNPAYNFTAAKGITYNGLKGLSAQPSATDPNPPFFDTVKYKGLDFVKYYQYDAARNVVNADPDIGWVTISDAAKAQRIVPIASPRTNETLPYITRSGNFWYVADLPFSFIGPRDRYLVFSDLLHDMLGSTHTSYHKAMVRLEDVGAMVSVQAMKTLSDYLSSKAVPFSVAVIPHYVDPMGLYNGGVRQEVPMSQASNLRTALNYAKARGGEMVMHGFTHQYGNMKNPHTGVSGDDYEFWNIVDNTWFPEDSATWVTGRLNNGLTEMKAAGFTPIAWESPHYHASAITSRTTPQLFSRTYQRAVYFTADKPNFYASVAKDFSMGQFYPYAIVRDYYGQKVLPENLGNIEYDIHTIDPTSNYDYRPEDLILNAKYAKTIRDGVASFFFHPFWLEPELGTPGLADFQKTVDGITALGFTWVAPSKLRQTP